MWLIFVGQEKEPRFVAYQAICGEGNDRLLREVELLKEVAAVSGEILPRLLDVWNILGLTVVIFAHVDGAVSITADLARSRRIGDLSSEMKKELYAGHFEMARHVVASLRSTVDRRCEIDPKVEAGQLLHSALSWFSSKDREEIGLLRGAMADLFEEISEAGSHGTGIVHFDCAPGNILQTDDRLIVIDWEFAQPSTFWWFDPLKFVYTYVVELCRFGLLEDEPIEFLGRYLEGTSDPFAEEANAFLDACGLPVRKRDRMRAFWLAFALREMRLFVDVCASPEFQLGPYKRMIDAIVGMGEWTKNAQEVQRQLDELEVLRASAKQFQEQLQARIDTNETLETKNRELEAEVDAARDAGQELVRLRSNLGSAAGRIEQLKANSAELAKTLDLAHQEGRELAAQLHSIRDSRYWTLLNRVIGNRWVRFSWRILPPFVKTRVKQNLTASAAPADRATAKTVLPQPKSSASTGTNSAGKAVQSAVRRTDACVFADLEAFLDRIDPGSANDLVVFVAGVKYIENEGQRVTQIVRGLIRDGRPVLLLYFRWESEHEEPVPESTNPLLFQLPLDLFEKRRKTVIDYPFRSSLRRTCVFEFPYPPTSQWVNEFNLAGWSTVYDVIDDWEEFHEVGKAVWYETAVEKYLCRAADAV
ncbi:MAG: phosphotransferase, partial [Rhodothermia bacterium]